MLAASSGFWSRVLVTTGLTVAPLVTPAGAGHSMGAMQMADAQDMPDDMACCPDKQNNKQCQDCPLVAICMLKVTPDWTFGGDSEHRAACSRTAAAAR
jgi:hypothetical protein